MLKLKLTVKFINQVRFLPNSLFENSKLPLISLDPLIPVDKIFHVE